MAADRRSRGVHLAFAARCRVGKSTAESGDHFRHAAKAEHILPLPKGEGRGEGEVGADNTNAEQVEALQPNWTVQMASNLRSSRRSLIGVRVAFGTFFCVMALVMIPGCATKAPPTRDEIHAQSGTLTNLVLTNAWKAAPTSTNVIRDNWLATFDDAQLNALVTEALTNNPDLQVAATRVEQAEQYVELAKAAMRPAVNLLGTGGLNMGGGDVSSALQGISLGASWEPDLWARMRYGRNAAQAQYASVQADYEFSRQTLAAAVAKAWFTASETWLQLEIAQNTVESAQEMVRLSEKRWQIGIGTEQDVALARANLGNYQDASEQMRLAHGQSLRALELLLGHYPAAELHARHDLTALPGPIPAGLPIQMLERRPDMVAAERRVAVAFNRVGEAKAAQLPRIVLNANVAALQSDILQLKEDFSNPTAGAGGKLIAPIYQGGALKTQVEIRTIEQQQAVAEYARLALRALGDVENGLAASQALQEREAVLRKAVADNKRALDLAETNYRVGKTDLRSVQQQQLALNSARFVLLRVQSEQLSQRANLHLALGGSFERPAPSEASGQAEDGTFSAGN